MSSKIKRSNMIGYATFNPDHYQIGESVFDLGYTLEKGTYHCPKMDISFTSDDEDALDQFKRVLACEIADKGIMGMMRLAEDLPLRIIIKRTVSFE